MPGPMGGTVFTRNGKLARDGYERHQDCRNRSYCNGPGCRINTGKTKKADQKWDRKIRDAKRKTSQESRVVTQNLSPKEKRGKGK
jgi:hypothetical protein